MRQESSERIERKKEIEKEDVALIAQSLETFPGPFASSSGTTLAQQRQMIYASAEQMTSEKEWVRIDALIASMSKANDVLEKVTEFKKKFADALLEPEGFYSFEDFDVGSSEEDVEAARNLYLRIREAMMDLNEKWNPLIGVPLN